MQIADNEFIGKKIKIVDMVNGDGQSVSFDDLIGKPAVIYFWASWCKPCHKTLVVLDKIGPEHNKDMSIVIVSLDDEIQQAKKVLSTLNITADSWFAIQGSIHLNQQDFGNTKRMLPYALLIDEEAMIKATDIRFRDQQQTQALLNKLKRI
ncbi:TlpA disulfide reductase family protein [Aliiglaciecola litoralis]|uniref:Thioredoxin domain-containing protein n=1 Tax=Aliiglaciecola litoralis TaxID=582857 RepID=A0ABN1LPG8_9ALTE